MDETLDSYYLFGLEALQERLPALAKEIDGVRAADDIEYVHRMRVASRRIRNALALFGDELPRKHYAAWRDEMRRVTKALGAARDTDVQLALVQEFLQQDTDDLQQVGIERLLLRLRQQRVRLQGKVVKALDRLEDKRILAEMNDTLQELLVHARVYEIETLPADLFRRANEAIRLRLEEFLAFTPHVAHPERVTELHQMRIAAKHLRYTLEVFEPLYERALRKPIKIVKEIQGLLGEVHDCDVWLSYVPQFIEEERARTLTYFGEAVPAQAFLPGLHALEENRREQRLHSYYIFRRFWELTQEKGIWDHLRDAVTPAQEKPVPETDEPPQG
ncbi:MAG TPA: CHAD domain-containing protein [Anaerolineae bacterium]|nr:CHAD domain-containing protein [Anaerolineae bacterium]